MCYVFGHLPLYCFPRVILVDTIVCPEQVRKESGMIKSKKELRELRNELELLTDFIRKMERRELPYFYRYFDTMKNNIEIFLCIGCDDIDDIVLVLERDWEASHTVILGVQNYDPHENNPDIDPQLCLCFFRLIRKVGEYFDNRTEYYA